MTTATAPRVEHSAAPRSLIECRDVSQIYQLGHGLFSEPKMLRAVDRVSLQLHAGEVLAIVGESGSGKTTLARMMLGLLRPTSGDIRFDGKPIAGHDRRLLARRVQAVFQDPYASLNPRKTLAEIIALPLVVHRIGKPSDRRARVYEMLDLVGLPRRLIHNYPSQLSGGQRQRVAIARALIMKPDIVVCDEPTSALDVSVQAQILNLLQELRERLALTYVFVSHDLSVVEYMADRVAVMYLGRIVELAPAKQIFKTPRHPYTQALLESVLTPDPHLDVPMPAIDRATPDPINLPTGCRFHPRCAQVHAPCTETSPVSTTVDDATVECHLYS
jgi:peptide/nickel transport system ATP-binding protein